MAQRFMHLIGYLDYSHGMNLYDLYTDRILPDMRRADQARRRTWSRTMGFGNLDADIDERAAFRRRQTAP